jgi:hypothetical protein
MTSGAEVNDATYLVEIDFVTLGIDELKKSALRIWPIPASEVIHIRGIDSNSNYKIINSIGKLVLSGKLNAGESSIDISSLLSGTYIVEVIDKETKQRISFIVI